MVDARTRLAHDVEGEVRRHFGSLVFRTSVPRSVRLAEAPSHGLPVDRTTTGAPAGADAYWKVAMELVERARRGLGRASELLVGGLEPSATELLELPVERSAPEPAAAAQAVRRRGGSGLAESIRVQGVIQPLLVRPRDAKAATR